MGSSGSVSVPTWEELKRLPCRTPVQQVPYPVVRISGWVYRIAPNMFISGSPYDRDLVRRDDGPFIGGVLWAATDGAADRATNFNIEADEDQTPVAPPVAMLLEPAARTYVEMLDELKSGRHGKFREGSEFRIAVDGKLIKNVIEVGPWEFCFRGVASDGATLPFAIIYELPCERSKYAGVNMSRRTRESR